MNIFFTGCTHFDYPPILTLADRPFADVGEMNEVITQNWNKVVRPQDMVYLLGDVSWGDHRSHARRLNGMKRYIKGNHDRASNELAKDWVDMATLYDIRKVGRVVLCHYPFEEWDAWHKGSIHLHAHTHSKTLVTAPRRFSVGVDANGFAPVSLEDILDHPNSDTK